MIEFKDYKLHDEVSIGPYRCWVTPSVSGNYFLLGIHCNVYQVFKYLGVDKYSYIKNICGYHLDGGFPEVRTLEDLNKVIKQLQMDCLCKEAKKK